MKIHGLIEVLWIQHFSNFFLQQGRRAAGRRLHKNIPTRATPICHLLLHIFIIEQSDEVKLKCRVVRRIGDDGRDLEVLVIFLQDLVDGVSVSKESFCRRLGQHNGGRIGDGRGCGSPNKFPAENVEEMPLTV